MTTTITFNNLSKADGSALIDQNNSIVQATVFGPTDITQSKINYEEAVVDILFKPKISVPPSSPGFDQIREMEDLLRSVFKEVILTRLHPRTSICILVQEIYNGGSITSAAINAVCCALIDAGLPMKCPVSAVTVEMNDLKRPCKIDFVFDKKLDLITILTRGCISEEDLKKAIEMGRKDAGEHFEVLRERVTERFTP